MRHSSNRETIAGVWGLAAGVVGSLCCIGPSAAILLGLGASSALLGWTLDRALTLGGGAALLAGAMLAWRRARACDLRPVTRWRTLALMLAGFVLAYGLLGLLIPVLAARQEDATADVALVASQRQSLSLPQGQAVAAAPLRQLTLSVEKMDCPPCAAHLRGLLKRKPFVRSFVAESGNEQVLIDYDSGQTTAQAVVALIPSNYGVTLNNDQALP